MYLSVTVQDMCTVGTNGGCHAQATCTTDQTTGAKTCACNSGYITPTGQTAGEVCGKYYIISNLFCCYQG